VLTWPFRTAFNAIADLWNNTVGKLSWTVPRWVPFLAGDTISVPQLPHFHAGGTVPGAPGQAVPILAMAGETVSATGQGQRVVLEIRSGGTSFDDAMVQALSRAVRRLNGNVQLALGGRNASA